MRVFGLVISFILASFFVKAQCSVTIESEDNKRFYLFIDGLKENDAPKSKVVVKKINEGPHHIKIIFEQKEINNPQEKVVWERGQSYNYSVKLYSNGNRKWYALSIVDQMAWSEKQLRKKGEDSLSVVELKLADKKTDSILKASTPPVTIAKPKDTNLVKVDTIKPPQVVLQEFNCTTPLHPKGFLLLLTQLEPLPDDKSRIEKAQILLRENCLSSIQIMEIMQLMDFEISKLEIATYAFPYCFDPKNFSFVEDEFEFDASVKELHDRIYAEKK
jgi:hypothetical protein